MNDSFTTEKELLERMQGGDQAAFKEIFYRYKDKLLSYCFRFTKSEAIAEEIVDDVLVKIWTGREHIDPTLSFNSYLYTITRNYSLNFLKKAATNTILKEKLFQYFEKSHCQPEEEVMYHDIKNIAERAIASLPPQRQRIYQMSREQAMSYEEIANRLGISKFTVKNQLAKALKTIRNYLHTHAEMNICILYVLLIISFKKFF